MLASVEDLGRDAQAPGRPARAPVLVQAGALVLVLAFGWTPWQPSQCLPRIPLRHQDAPVEFAAVSFFHGVLFPP